MTLPNHNTALEEILCNPCKECFQCDFKKQGECLNPYKECSVCAVIRRITKKATESINKLMYEEMLELIGEDLPVFKYIDALVDDKKRKAVNKYKARLRQAAAERYGVEV